MAWENLPKGVSLGNLEAQCMEVAQEYNRARKIFPMFRSSHEGYAVILEELEEMWDEIKANNIPDARKECIQLAAMALAFLLEVKE